MATFKKGHYARTILTRQITVGSVATTPPIKAKWWYVDPADYRTLRGIPAIGHIAGAIPGTRPDKHQIKDDS